MRKQRQTSLITNLDDIRTAYPRFPKRNFTAGYPIGETYLLMPRKINPGKTKSLLLLTEKTEDSIRNRTNFIWLVNALDSYYPSLEIIGIEVKDSSDFDTPLKAEITKVVIADKHKKGGRDCQSEDEMEICLRKVLESLRKFRTEKVAEPAKTMLFQLTSLVGAYVEG